ncbi:MAG TPA: lipid II flippase MurJ, partial [Nitriliruptorales bacterium]|nr:lipid II flippase MurJ [Nitriliruptorales bacterium]
LFVLPISLFGMSVAAAELPELSSADPTERDRVADRLQDGLARIAFYVVPSALVFFTLGDLIVATLFQTGAFDRADTVLVWLILAGFSVGLLSNTSSRLLQSAFYAGGDARTPAMYAVVRVAVAAAVGAVLMLQLDRVALTSAGFELRGALPAFTPLPQSVRTTPDALHLGAVGLAVAAGASSWIEFALLRRRLSRVIGRRVGAGGGHLGSIVGAAALAGLVAVGTRWLVAGSGTLLAGPLALVVTGLAYVAAAYLLRVPEIRDLTAVTRRWRRGR